jgi:glycosyltransferase involved in cell wall biosynthesis
VVRFTNLTVILPTFRRPDALGRALDALAAQEDPGVAWELVVIDNDDPPGAEATVDDRGRHLPVPVRFVREPRRGASHARNRGIEEATGDIIVMLDDDVVPKADWLARLVEPILEGRCDATGGRVILDPTVAWPRWLDPTVAHYLSLFEPSEHEVELEALLTASAAWATDLLRKTGGFDPALGPRDGVPLVADDNDLTRRFIQAGGRVRFVPDAIVVHELTRERLRKRYLLRRAWAQGRSDWILDREQLLDRRFHGARSAKDWLATEVRRRFRDGVTKPHVTFHLACDLVRTAGALREGASWYVRRRSHERRCP